MTAYIVYVKRGYWKDPNNKKDKRVIYKWENNAGYETMKGAVRRRNVLINELKVKPKDVRIVKSKTLKADKDLEEVQLEQTTSGWKILNKSGNREIAWFNDKKEALEYMKGEDMTAI
jgi:hypothetical protein